LSKIALNLDEASWVGSIYLIGGTVSSLFYGWTAEKYGRKTTIILAALPQVVSKYLSKLRMNSPP
jgi:MFS family permease